MDFEELLALGTKNPAMALELYPKKGAVKEESDADILIMNEDLSLDTVIAMGVPMMRDGKSLKRERMRNNVAACARCKHA